MKKLVFDYKKFKGLVTSYAVDEAAAQIAQSIFDEWLKSANVVYSSCDRPSYVWTAYDDGEPDAKVDKFQALLVCIEPIKPKCEKCEPKYLQESVGEHITYSSYCGKCGVEIEPTGWKEKE